MSEMPHKNKSAAASQQDMEWHYRNTQGFKWKKNYFGKTSTDVRLPSLCAQIDDTMSLGLRRNGFYILFLLGIQDENEERWNKKNRSQDMC